MNRTDRLQRIKQLLSSNKSTPTSLLLEQLGVSRATVKRDLEYLRDRLGAPIIWDAASGGYKLEKSTFLGPFELPGIWFTAGEMYALLAAQNLLSEIEPGILAERVTPLRNKLATLLGAAGHTAADVAEKVRLISLGRRKIESKFFSLIALTLLERRRLGLEVYIRGRDEVTERIVSPQRLIHYRDNWYLDAWRHLRDGLRTFAVESVRRAWALPEECVEVSDEALKAHFAAGYGIFAGPPKATAVLRFSPARARWVKGEIWHPSQTGESLPDGGRRLSIPFSDHRARIRDVLKHASEAEAAKFLCAKGIEEALNMVSIYN